MSKGYWFFFIACMSFGLIVTAWPVWKVVSQGIQSPAQGAARSMVENGLKAPATAVYQSVNVVAEQPPHYIVHVVVDAQNSFGAQVRSSFLTAFELIDDNRRFQYKPTVALQESQNPPSEEEIALMKQMNWPAPDAH